ncbi:MAG: asparagine synthase (glutamine-hydrolyzing) [bacterium]|nr:asparagine synthase (glutamine-hydrolyzing) [bacterium]
MCSINGFTIGAPELILNMNGTTKHRGPDGTGVWHGKGVTLGHNRLSIIDLSERGAQPMTDSSKRLTIVFNGEIYNYQELRAELQGKYTFKSDSDTEVILNAYLEYGKECVKKFNGIFAFALWDEREQELFLARDQNGVKPLYYFWDTKRFIFSSEIKAILEHSVPREVDREAFNLYMRVGYVPEPYTMFRGIKKLPPAHYAVLKGNEFSLKKYWEIADVSNLSSREETVADIRKLFKDSVKRQLISDRPVGIFLSGGIDSTAVLGATKEVSSGKVKTYSVGFAVDVQQEKFNADFLLARETAKAYGTDHHELMISGKDIGAELKNIAWHLDEPNANPTAGAIYLLSRLAKKEVAVVLGGDGADELFGGYQRYALSRTLRAVSRLPLSVRKALSLSLAGMGKKEASEKMLIAGGTSLFLSFLSQKEGDVASILNPQVAKGGVTRSHFERYFKNTSLSGDFEKQFMNTDRQSWLTDDSLLRSDKMSMAFGLEQRVPILDYRLLELAYRIPTNWKLKGGGLSQNSFQGKQIWKEAVLPYLPEHIRHQQKRGFFTPMAKWLRTDLREEVMEILSPAHLNSEFFNVEAVQQMWQDHLQSKKYNLTLIWSVVMWQLWYDTFIK